jgi:hypothetical protein
MQLALIVLYQANIHPAKERQGGFGVVSTGLVRYRSVEGSLSKVNELIPCSLNLRQGCVGACRQIFNVGTFTLENQPEVSRS